MSQSVMRAEECPHCGGTVTVIDEPMYVEEQSAPVKWIIVKATCENGCDLLVGDIAERQT